MPSIRNNREGIYGDFSNYITSVNISPPTYLINDGGIKIANNTYEYGIVRETDKLKEQIEKMAEFISKIDVDEEICKNVKIGICEKYNNGNCKDCIIKYFEEGG